MKNSKLLLIVVFAVVLQSCSTQKNAVLTSEKWQLEGMNKNLHDIWAVTEIEGKPINKTTTTPRVEINLTTNKVLGNDGCNNFFGVLNEVSNTKLVFGSLAGTKKMCPNMEVSNSFHKAMPKVKTYKLENLNLILLDENGKEVLKLLKVD